MRPKSILIVLCTLSALAGCAAPARHIEPIEPADGAFLDSDCSVLISEHERVVSSLRELGAKVDAAASHERAAMSAGVLFWPAFFMVQANDEVRARYARELGIYERIRWQWQRRDCDDQTAKSLKPVLHLLSAG